MAEFKKKSKYSFWQSPLALIILFGIFVFFACRVIILYEKERETERKKIAVMEQVDSLKSREQVISLDINKLNTEEGLEDIIREKYQVAKEGEKMVIIVDEEKDKNPPVKQPKHGFWNWIKGVFGK